MPAESRCLAALEHDVVQNTGFVAAQGTFAERPDDFCLYPRPSGTQQDRRCYRIARKPYSIQQQRINDMKAPLASLEKPDFAKIEKRAPSVARMFLDRVAATPHAEAFRYPQDDELGERDLAAGR